MTTGRSLDALFNPRNVALVGASDRPGHWSSRVRDNLTRFGFPGAVQLVNPGRDALWNARCYPTLAELPERPDHLAIFTPAAVVLDVLREGAAAGARSATIYASGFGEGGSAEGREMAERLRSTLAETGIVAVGPSCMGVANGSAAFSTIPDESMAPLTASPVALIAQSGAICNMINRAVNALGLTLGHIASCGSQIGVRMSEFVTHLTAQPEVRVILCYIEAIPDPVEFLEAARQARLAGKVVVAVKVGGSEESRAAALAHTGALAGRAEIFRTYAEAVGIIVFAALEDALQAVEFLARAPLPTGQGIAAMTLSGALRSLLTEAAAVGGVALPALSEATVETLKTGLGQDDIANPLDTRITLPTPTFRETIETVTSDAAVDVLLIVEELPLAEDMRRKVGNLRALNRAALDARAHGKVVAMLTPLHGGTSDFAEALRGELADVPILHGAEAGIKVAGAIARSGALPLHPGVLFAEPDPTAGAEWRARAATLTGPSALDEVDSKRLLAAYGIPLPAERVVATANEAVAAAGEIGFPVVLKGVSAAITHKSDAGLVLLALRDDAAVRDGVALLEARAAEAGARLDGVIVAEMVHGGIEAVLGGGNDVEMGPFVMVGSGGIWLELFQDVAFVLPTADRAAILSALQRTRLNVLLNGYRGAPAGDIAALLDALLGLNRLMRDLGDIIQAIDINPFVVRPAGQGTVALDGLVVLQPPRAAAAGGVA